MRYRILGRTGLRVSEIGIGGVGAMGKYGALTPDEFSQTMSRAEELGVNFLDTAPAYGDSEVVFGHYLRDHRANWIVCTKVGTCGSWGDGSLCTREQISHQVSASLKRLSTDYIDVLLIHSIDQFGEGRTAIDRVLNESDMLDSMKELRSQGKVRFIGVSGRLPELKYAAGSGVFDVILTYNTYNLLVQDAETELFPIAQEHNLGVILAGAFYQGLITDPDFLLRKKEIWFEKTDPAYLHTEEMIRKRGLMLEHLGGELGRLKEMAVRFCLSHPAVSVLVSGMRMPREVEENVRTADIGPLSRAEMEELLGAASCDLVKDMEHRT